MEDKHKNSFSSIASGCKIKSNLADWEEEELWNMRRLTDNTHVFVHTATTTAESHAEGVVAPEGEIEMY